MAYVESQASYLMKPSLKLCILSPNPSKWKRLGEEQPGEEEPFGALLSGARFVCLFVLDFSFFCGGGVGYGVLDFLGGVGL